MPGSTCIYFKSILKLFQYILYNYLTFSTFDSSCHFAAQPNTPYLAMYVNILSFKIDERDGISGNEFSMLEDSLSPKPRGLDRVHIFKDKAKKNQFYLIEYWKSVDDKNKLESSEKFSTLKKIHTISRDHRYKKIECDVVI